jgi:hypothetical protein
MAVLKTKPTAVSPTAYLNAVADEQRRKDGKLLMKLMREITGERAKMWGPSIVGFGKYHYKYASGHEGEICLTGFSPRKQSLVLYLGPGLENAELMSRLGKHKRGKGCLYINKLDDVDLGVLRELIQSSVDEMRRRHPAR